MIIFNILREEIVNTSLNQIGKDYVHNTYGPNSFDCAGLVFYIYNLVMGINIFEDGIGKSTTTKVMTSKYGKLVLFDEEDLAKDLSLIKKGDVLFFHTQSLKDNEPKSNNKYPGHCGIYIGDDSFIHANSKIGHVATDNFNDNKKLYKRLVGFKNIID